MTRRRMHALAALLCLGTVACVAAETEPGNTADQAAVESAVEEILDNPLADEDYRKERSCLWRREVDSVEIIDERILVFRGRVKKRVWVNRLSRPCVGLRRDMVVTTRARTGSICRLDAIDARPRGAGPFEPAVRCHLSGFEEIDEGRIEAMKRAVEEHAKTDRKTGRATSKGNGRRSSGRSG